MSNTYHMAAGLTLSHLNTVRSAARSRRGGRSYWAGGGPWTAHIFAPDVCHAFLRKNAALFRASCTRTRRKLRQNLSQEISCSCVMGNSFPHMGVSYRIRSRGCICQRVGKVYPARNGCPPLPHEVQTVSRGVDYI